ncbi:MAG TPA: hypothetical protein VNB06_19215, partial [Thermoanaerobaculia bacterium]|nr:hypothetical protein [Thermoanaerobaculia bacterium]
MSALRGLERPSDQPPRRGAAWRAWLALAALAATGTVVSTPAGHGEPTPGSDDVIAAGVELLLHQPLSSAALTVDELDRLWTVWEPAERARAEGSTPVERRALAFERYGFTRRPDGPAWGPSDLPLGYTADVRGNLYPNCLACHGGEVAGQVIVGLGNTQQDVQTLLEDLAALRAKGRGADPEAA